MRSIKNYLIGAGSIIELIPANNGNHFKNKVNKITDAELIGQDFIKVGQDIKKSMNAFYNEKKGIIKSHGKTVEK